MNDAEKKKMHEEACAFAKSVADMLIRVGLNAAGEALKAELEKVSKPKPQ